MLNNVNDILTATGPRLLEPLTFGPMAGKRLYQIQPSYYDELAQMARIDKVKLYNQARAAAALYRSQKRDIITTKHAEKSDIQPILGENLSLYAHQRDFIERFYDKNYGAMFFDIGTGKTRTAVTLLKMRWMQGSKALIVCPKSVFSGWVKEITETSDLSCVTVSGTAEQKRMKLNVKRDIYITNYETALSDAIWQDIINAGFDWIILDESHKIKSHVQKTAADRPTIAQRFRELGAIIKNRFILTGTPITNNEKDIWSQAYFLDRGESFGPSFSKFYKEYFSKGHFSYYSGQFKHEREALFKRKLEGFSMRVTKADCLDLPAQTWITRDVELTGEALKTYIEVLRSAILILKDATIPIQNKVAEILRLRQICGGGVNAERFNSDKLKELDEILDEMSDRPVIVTTFRHELDDIAKLLKKRKMSYGRIDGSVAQDARDQAIADFSAGALDAFIMQIDAGGVGVNGLQNHSSTMIFYSLPYKWDAVKQAEGRIHRSGQTRPCTYVRLLTYITDKIGRQLPTIEAAVIQRLAEKDSNIERLIDDIIRGTDDQL